MVPILQNLIISAYIHWKAECDLCCYFIRLYFLTKHVPTISVFTQPYNLYAKNQSKFCYILIIRRGDVIFNW